MIFQHSGDLGDIIYSLPTVRALGGGHVRLVPEHGTRMTWQTAKDMCRFLRDQEYVESAEIANGEKPDVDLDQFRSFLNYRNLADAHLDSVGLPHHWRDVPWLAHQDPFPVPRSVVISRAPRALQNDDFWKTLPKSTFDDAYFVGFEDEHKSFEEVVGCKVVWLKTNTIWMLASVIASCQKFYGNQSLALAIAEGMKKPIVYEVYKPAPSNLFDRDGLVCV